MFDVQNKTIFHDMLIHTYSLYLKDLGAFHLKGQSAVVLICNIIKQDFSGTKYCIF